MGCCCFVVFFLGGGVIAINMYFAEGPTSLPGQAIWLKGPIASPEVPYQCF